MFEIHKSPASAVFDIVFWNPNFDGQTLHDSIPHLMDYQRFNTLLAELSTEGILRWEKSGWRLTNSMIYARIGDNIDESMISPTVVALAEALEIGVLGDCLEEAGANKEIVHICRTPEYRGMIADWIIDWAKGPPLIDLPMHCIFEAEPPDMNALERVEYEMSVEDCEYYDRVGWEHYREEDFVDHLLPTLGEPRCFMNYYEIVIPINGRNYVVIFNFDYDRNMWDPAGKSISLLKTNKKPTEPNSTSYRSYLRFFGQPRWIQSKHYPFYMGKPCFHFCTIENGWGDAGNWNILIGCDRRGVPEKAFFEASCY